jgi:hypothetical protein
MVGMDQRMMMMIKRWRVTRVRIQQCQMKGCRLGMVMKVMQWTVTVMVRGMRQWRRRRRVISGVVMMRKRMGRDWAQAKAGSRAKGKGRRGSL